MEKKKNGVVAPKATPIQVVNANISQLGKRKRANNNNNKNNNGPPPVRGPNTQSGVGGRNSMADNKNKNLNNNASFSGNSQPNNRSKKPKINVNVAQRNRLLKNLKNKGLSKNVINRFIKNYNNGTKGVNQILQEVKVVN